MAPTIRVSIDELHKMQTTEEVMNWRTIARFFYGAQFWIEEQAMRHLERLNTVSDLHATLMTAHDAADAEFDGYLAKYRGSDAKAAHAAAGEPSDLDKWLDALAVDEAQGEFTDWRM